MANRVIEWPNSEKSYLIPMPIRVADSPKSVVMDQLIIALDDALRGARHENERLTKDNERLLDNLKNDRLLEKCAALNITLFHVEKLSCGLAHPDERVRLLIQASEAAKEKDGG